MAPSLDLLKINFGKRTGEKWEINALKGMTLRGSHNQPEDFFQVLDEPIVQSPTILGTTKFVLGQSIVPVVAHVQGERVLRCLGTGFFVSCSGLLTTAAHVVTDPIERRYGRIRRIADMTWHADDLNIGVMIPLNPLLQGGGYIFRRFEWSTFLSEESDRPLPIAGVDLKLKSDVAICQVEPIAVDVPHQPLAIIQKGLVGSGMAVGRNAAVVGYGAMRDVELSQHRENVLSGQFRFDLHVAKGEILERFPENHVDRRVPTPGPCFAAALKLPGGMSGSPVFDDEGIYAHGVVSKGWVDENGPTAYGYGSMLAPSLSVPIHNLNGRSLLDLFSDHSHGFPKLSGPGL